MTTRFPLFRAVLSSVARVLGDLGHGVHAGHAIRHGLPVPARRSRR
ncbi:hypothetical protein [Goodfellowiella coeruleoviolacea]|uniref:Uncharacterized protein n=1 Tax=Goodfellowiella coeruleoviolacea TaxID=334858 RepID=A0AAE3KKV3_9PSEU|nr:hypothetical protein [Goodfellowiella coeruleoviolacea]MCP2169759.1 hypothetical protein [Goodfellowiella coeruleoviolacea]